MSEQRDGKTVYPVASQVSINPLTGVTTFEYESKGIPTRTWLAGLAMQGELAAQSSDVGEWGYSGYPELAKRCVAIADALLEELGK